QRALVHQIEQRDQTLVVAELEQRERGEHLPPGGLVAVPVAVELRLQVLPSGARRRQRRERADALTLDEVVDRRDQRVDRELWRQLEQRPAHRLDQVEARRELPCKQKVDRARRLPADAAALAQEDVLQVAERRRRAVL